jgi:outer membrane protein assembly factor BamB
MVVSPSTASQGAQWAQTVTAGGNRSYFKSVSVASDGSAYAAGWIEGTGIFNFGNSVTSAGTYTDSANIVLVKYNSSGVAQWARSVTAGNNISFFNSVSMASDGSVYAAGDIYGTGTFSFGNNVTAAGTYSGSNIVLVKYNSSGVAQWARSVTAGNNVSSFNSVSVSSDGSVYTAGRIIGTDTYDFGNSVTATGPSTDDNIVLVKYNSSGSAQWAKTVTAGNNSAFNSVSVASDGSVYAGGFIMASSYDFGNGVTAVGGGSGARNIILVKYNSSGVAQWARSVIMGGDESFFRSVSVASDGSVYAAGYTDRPSTYDFGNNVTITNPFNGNNILLVKYNSSGVAQWARSVTAGNGQSRFDSVSVAADGSVYAAGYIAGTGTFNFGNSITSAGPYIGGNILLVKYDSSGVAQWARTVTMGSFSSYFSGVSVASDGSVYAAGQIYGTGTYDFGNSVTTAGTYPSCNMLLVKYY